MSHKFSAGAVDSGTDVIFSVEVYLLGQIPLNFTKSFTCSLRLAFFGIDDIDIN